MLIVLSSFAVFTSLSMQIVIDLNERVPFASVFNVSRRETAHFSEKAASCSLVADFQDVDLSPMCTVADYRAADRSGSRIGATT